MTLKKKVIMLTLIVLTLAVCVQVGAQVIIGRGDIAVDELEVQVDGVDVLCLAARFKSQRHGIGLSCDWTNSQVTEPVDYPPLPTPTPAPPPYLAEVNDD